MSHVFEEFKKKDWKNIKTVFVKVEKDTKKAVKETIERLDELTKESHLIIHVDATVLKDEEKIAQLVAYSLFHFRNINSFSFRAIKVDLGQGVQVNEAYRNLFEKLKQQGGSWERYAEQKGFDWRILNAVLNEEIDSMYNRLISAQEKYDQVLKQVPLEITPLENNYMQWNFNASMRDLYTLYKSCFNEVDYILSPHSCINPNPSFQRKLVWDEEKKQRFILSVLNDIPIGAFYVNTAEDFNMRLKLGEGFGGLLWDGKQRIHALHDFIQGKYAVLIGGKWVKYHDNPGFFNIKFSRFRITVFESHFNTLKEIIEAYVAINFAQVKHTDEDLKHAMAFLEQETRA